MSLQWATVYIVKQLCIVLFSHIVKQLCIVLFSHIVSVLYYHSQPHDTEYMQCYTCTCYYYK